MGAAPHLLAIQPLGRLAAILQQYRWPAVVGSLFGLPPAVVTCIYVPLFGEPRFDDRLGWGIVAFVLAVFAPLHEVVEPLFGGHLVIASSHMVWAKHYEAWLIFTAFNSAMWMVVWVAATALIRRLLRHRRASGAAG